jgi:LPS-assembly lipoprotein
MYSTMPRGRLRALLLLLAAALLLSACGFKLRGSSGSYNLPFLKMYLALPPSSPLAIELKRNIRVNGSTEVVTDIKQADGILELVGDPDKTRGKSILALNSNGRVSQYLLTYNVTFRIRDNLGHELLAPTSLSLSRAMDYSDTEVLAKESEEATLYRDMQLDLVQQMMRRMARIKPVNTMSSPAAALPAASPSTPVNPPSAHQ